MQKSQAKISGVVLSGGRARRMGGTDKGLILFRGRPLVSYALDALKVLTDEIYINANRNLGDYRALGYPVVCDEQMTYDGPLAGTLSAMRRVETPYLLTLPCDCPLIRGDLLARFPERLEAEGAEICAAHDGTRLHPVFLLLDCRLLVSLESYMASGRRKIDTWLARHRLVLADFSDQPDMFLNINTAEELASLEQRIGNPGGGR